jgi:ABC-type taurine transport system substrate-binding protein
VYAPAADLIAKGYHSLVDAEQIAKLGIPGLDVIAVATSVINTDPTLVQDYVCAELQGSRDMTGPQAARFLTATAKVQGIPASQAATIVAATKGYPFIPPSQQLYWLGSTLHDPTSRIVKAYRARPVRDHLHRCDRAGPRRVPARAAAACRPEPPRLAVRPVPRDGR